MSSLSLSSQKDGGALSEADRKRLRSINHRLAAENRVRVAWEAKILAELAEGSMTRDELLAVICPNWRPQQQKAVGDAIRRLAAKGRVTERPMLEPAGRAVRVNPVLVLELIQ